jgi:hypothetical protein
MKEERHTTPRLTSGTAAWIAGAAVFVLLKWLYIGGIRFDTDEPQHLHVIWGWTQGLVQYRDFFDNHTPLFHLLFAPLLALLPESPTTLLVMRWMMVPITLGALACVYAIGRALFSRRAAIWATAWTAFFPAFFLVTTEFRSDILWMALWLLSLAILVSGRMGTARVFVAGLILGAAAGVSLKTSLLAATLLCAAAPTIALARARGRSLPFRRLALWFGAWLAGLAVIPLALVVLFASLGALGPFLYGAIGHNLLPGLGSWHNPGLRYVLLPVWIVVILAIARAVLRRAVDPSRGIRRGFLVLYGGIYLVALESLWPLVERQSKLLYWPLLFLLVAPPIVAFLNGGVKRRPADAAARWGRRGAVIAASLLLVEVGALLALDPPRVDAARKELDFVADVLRMTDPGQAVIDPKGETVFRPRATGYVLEKITRERIRRGLLPDDIQERAIAERACVAAADHSTFPPRTRAFLNANFISVGRLRVAGGFLADSARAGGDSMEFTVVIPARYVIVSDAGEVTGLLDGTAYDGPRTLAAGPHTFQALSPHGKLAFMWAQAWERGFTPFSERSADT